ELAVANAIGSNIFNTLFILGAAALITPLIISKQLIRQDVPIMIGVSILAVILTMDGSINTWEAGLLVACLIAYTWFLMYQGKKQNINITEGEVAELLEAKTPIWSNLALVAIGLVLLVVGARWLVNAAVEIATLWGVNEAVIGLTIIARSEERRGG